MNDLKFVSDEIEETQTAIVQNALQSKVETLKKRIQRKKEKETQEAVTI